MKHRLKIVLSFYTIVIIGLLPLISGCEWNSKNLISKVQEKIKQNQQVTDQEIEAIVGSLTLEEKIGQMLMPDFRTWNGDKVTVINEEIKEVIRKYHLGGVILFRENISSASQIKKLIQDIQNEGEIPLLISIDQEGGLVNRISFIPEMPGNMALGATRDPQLAEKVGEAIGQELKALGINMDMAPVLDVNNNAENPVIGIRSFGENPSLVAEMGIAFANGLQKAGIIPVGKHFPGHGDTNADSHYVLPILLHEKERLEQVELVPFQAAIDAGIPALMTAHITFTAIDATEVKSKKDGLPIALPATLSKKVLTDLMRTEMGYSGILMTDALDMKAISDHFGSVEAGIQAIEAGNDILLMPIGIDAVFNGLLQAVKNGVISEERINQSVQRILRVKLDAGLFVNVNNEAISKNNIDVTSIEKEVAKASVTLVKNNDILPLSTEGKQRIIILADRTVLNDLDAGAKSRFWNTKPVEISKASNGTGILTASQKEALNEADIILVASKTSFGKSKDNYQNRVVEDLLKLKKPTIAIALGSPYDLGLYPDVDAAIATYSDSYASIDAAMDVIFGNAEAKGRLPVTIYAEDGKVLYQP